MMLKLVIPTEEYKEQVLSYKAEFLENGDDMAGTSGLRHAETFEAWLARDISTRSEKTVPEGRVPAWTYLAINEAGRLVGMINVRYRLTPQLLQYAGNIGYSIRKCERRKGYATEMLSLALIEAKKLGLDRVLITCDKSNIASAKTILKNGGVLENELRLDDGEIVQRYWIEL